MIIWKVRYCAMRYRDCTLNSAVKCGAEKRVLFAMLYSRGMKFAAVSTDSIAGESGAVKQCVHGSFFRPRVYITEKQVRLSVIESIMVLCMIM